MRIIIITDEPWNDILNGNNVLTNWFQGFEAEFANIYCSPGLPNNTICDSYFQITDSMMVKSIFTGKKAGVAIDNSINEGKGQTAEGLNTSLYGFLKSITTESLRLVREWIWVDGRYDEDALKKFLLSFNPDVIFSIRMGTMKILRLERIVHKLTDTPFFAFVGDDEYSLRQFSFSPAYWIRRFGIRQSLRKNVQFYDMYFCQTEEQAKYYSKIFPCQIGTLNKCGNFSYSLTDHSRSKPVVLIYAGKLYCNRWKVLADIAAAIKEINNGKTIFQLNIYTKDKLTGKQNKLLNDGVNSVVKGSATQEELKTIYKSADIALHVESKDIKNRLATRLSFSTKIMDCMSSGCAVMAYCWEEQAGYKYLHDHDCAFCVCNHDNLVRTLSSIKNNPNLINEYAAKVKEIGKQGHQRDIVQAKLRKCFEMSMK